LIQIAKRINERSDGEQTRRKEKKKEKEVKEMQLNDGAKE